MTVGFGRALQQSLGTSRGGAHGYLQRYGGCCVATPLPATLRVSPSTTNTSRMLDVPPTRYRTGDEGIRTCWWRRRDARARSGVGGHVRIAVDVGRLGVSKQGAVRARACGDWLGGGRTFRRIPCESWRRQQCAAWQW